MKKIINLHNEILLRSLRERENILFVYEPEQIILAQVTEFLGSLDVCLSLGIFQVSNIIIFVVLQLKKSNHSWLAINN